MEAKIIFTIILVLFPLFTSASINSDIIQFVADYFNLKKVKILTTFACSKYDSFQLKKRLISTSNIWLVSAHPDHPVERGIDYVIMRTYNKFGIFVDYDCDAGKNFLEELASFSQLTIRECRGMYCRIEQIKHETIVIDSVTRTHWLDELNIEYLWKSPTYDVINSERKSLNDSYNWLVWSNMESPETADDLNLHIDTDMTWANPDVHSSRLVLHDLYKINYSWPVNSTLAGHWEPGKGINYSLKQYKYSRRQDMLGIVFKAGLAVNNIPLENLKEELGKPQNRKMDAMATYNYKVFTLLMQFYNFSIDIIPSHLYGYVVENGREEGLTLMLKNHEVDFSISAIQTNRARYRCTDFMSVPTWEFRLVALFRHPPVNKYYGQVLLQPFEMNVWTACGGMWVIVILCIRFVSWVEIKTFDYVAQTNEEETVRSWSDSLMIIIGAISEQGTTMDSKWVAWRIAFLAAFILSMMVNVNYSASLVSSLLSTPTKNIKTTKDLIDSSLSFGAEEISYSIPYFALNSDPLIHELYVKKMAPPHQAYYPREVALVKMRKEYFTYHTEAIKVFQDIEDTFTDKEKCELSEVLLFVPEKCYLPIPWGSPHKEAITFALRKIAEIGLINWQDRIWRIPKPPCTIKEEFVSVDMDKISPSFVIIIVGSFASIILLLIEIITGRRRKNQIEVLQQPTQVRQNNSRIGKDVDLFGENIQYFTRRGHQYD